MKHTVYIWLEPQTIEVLQQSGDVWVAEGSYAGSPIRCEGRTRNEAIRHWADAARAIFASKIERTVYVGTEPQTIEVVQQGTGWVAEGSYADTLIRCEGDARNQVVGCWAEAARAKDEMTDDIRTSDTIARWWGCRLTERRYQ